MRTAVFYEFQKPSENGAFEIGKGHFVCEGVPDSNAKLDKLDVVIGQTLKLDGPVTITSMTLLPDLKPANRLIAARR